MDNVTVDRELDTRGLNCPMPLVKARQAVAQLGVGQVLKVIATDRGSLKDFQGWANIAKNIELVGQETAERAAGNEYLHYIRRTA
jgi:tRNA 2-thiouridine synthesizing protein A